MSSQHTGNVEPSIDLEEHRSVNGVNAKAVIPYYIDSSGNPQPSVADQVAQAVYDAMVRLQPYQSAIPYARDTSDQMRVVIGSGTISSNTMSWGNQNNEPTYYSTGGANSIDAREQLALQSEANFNTIRLGRWVIT